MPRTKQSKPRHIVEDQKSSEIAKGEKAISVADSLNFLPNRKKNGELRESNSPCFTSISPENQFEQLNISGELFDKLGKEMEQSDEDQNTINKEHEKDADKKAQAEKKLKEPSALGGTALTKGFENQNVADPNKFRTGSPLHEESSACTKTNITSEGFKDGGNTHICADAVVDGNSNGDILGENASAENHQKESLLVNDASTPLLSSLKNTNQLEAANDVEFNKYVWKALLNNTTAFSAADNAADPNHASLVNDYIRKLMESWNSKLKAISKSKLSSSSTADKDEKCNFKTDQVCYAMPETVAASDREKENEGNCDVSTPTSIERNSNEAVATARDRPMNDKPENFLSYDHRNHFSLQNCMTDKDREKQKYESYFGMEKNKVPFTGYLSPAKQATAFSFPNYGNFHSFHSPNNLTSGPFLKFSKYGQLHPSSFYSYNPWVNPAWFNYNSRQVSAFPSYFPYQQLPFSPTDLKDKWLRSRNTFKLSKKNETANQTASSHEESERSPAVSSASPIHKHPDANKSFKTSDQQNGTSSDLIQDRSDVSFLPYNSLWLGNQLSSKPTQQLSSIAGVNQALNFSQKYPGLYFPSEKRFAVSPRLSPSGESYANCSPFRRESDESAPSSIGKMLNNRRSRVRGPAFDSIHAAIVREAKEQSKGVDPENMYIQCPICQKRIKRLYHFQRHMRIHTGEKIHQCPCCQYKSVRKDNLKSHMKTHEKQNSEGGRKGNKSTYQSTRYSYNSNEKSPERSSGLTNSKNCVLSFKDVGSKQENEFDITKENNGKQPHAYSSTCIPSPSLNSEFSRTQRFVENDLPRQEKDSQMYPTKSSRNYRDTQYCNEKRVKSSDRLNYIDLAGISRTKIGQNDKVSLDKQKNNHDSKKREMDKVQSPSLYSEEIQNKRFKFTNENQTMSINSLEKTKSYNNNEGGQNSNSPNSLMPYPFSYSLNNSFESILNTSDAESTAIQSSDQNPLNNQPVTPQEEAALKIPPTRPESQQHEPLPNPVLVSEAEKTDPTKKEPDASGSPDYSGTTSVDDNCEKLTQTADSERQNDANSNDVAKDFFNKNSNVLPYFQSNRKVLENMYKQRNHHILPSDFLQCNGISSDKINLPNSGKNPNYEKLFPNSPEHKSKSFKIKNLQDSLPSKLLQCRLCPFTTLSNAELQSHVTNKHKQNGFYKCEECTYLGKNLSKLVEHIRIHTGERPFKCDQCTYAAKRKDNLAQHKAVRHDKRKAKSSAHYTSLTDFKTDSPLLSSTVRNMRCLQGAKDSRKGTSSKSHSAIPDQTVLSHLNLPGNFCAENKEMNKLTVPGSLMTPFHSIPAIPNLTPGLFQFPYYHQFSPVITTSDLESSIPVSASSTVKSQSNYSLNARAALIAP